MVNNPHTLSAAACDVLAERARQIETEGWTTDHDDLLHVDGEIALAAACYATPFKYRTTDWLQNMWPWSFAWWKPGFRRDELVKAGALILAEIERIDRLTGVEGGQS